MFCRCRYDDSDMCALKFDGDERVICTTVQGRKKMFEFEKMYTPDTAQETVSPFLEACATLAILKVLEYSVQPSFNIVMPSFN